MPSFGGPELIIVLAIGLLLFGSTRIPKLARSLGEARREFTAGTEEHDRDQASQSTSDDAK